MLFQVLKYFLLNPFNFFPVLSLLLMLVLLMFLLLCIEFMQGFLMMGRMPGLGGFAHGS